MAKQTRQIVKCPKCGREVIRVSSYDAILDCCCTCANKHRQREFLKDVFRGWKIEMDEADRIVFRQNENALYFAPDLWGNYKFVGINKDCYIIPKTKNNHHARQNEQKTGCYRYKKIPICFNLTFAPAPLYNTGAPVGKATSSV